MAAETRHDAILGLIDAAVASVPTVGAAVVLVACIDRVRQWLGYRAVDGVLRDALCVVLDAAGAHAAMQARVALLEGLLREALEGLDALVDDPRDPAIRKLLRRMRAALADGG